MLSVEKKKYTIDDYLMLEEGSPFQLINYDLVMSPSPNSVHQAIAVRLSQIILNFLESEQKGGYTAVSMDVVFSEGNVFQPDFLYVSEARVDKIVKDRIEGPPDMTIEILSPSNAYYDLLQKKEVYEKYSVEEYIIFDPVAQNAYLYILRNGAYHLQQKAQKNELLHSIILPGLSFNLNYIFK